MVLRPWPALLLLLPSSGCEAPPLAAPGLPETADVQDGPLFLDVTADAGLDLSPQWGGGVAAFDADGDPYLDLLFTDHGGSALFHGLGDLRFARDDAFDLTALGVTGAVWAVTPADVDNDGDQDLFVGTGEADHLLLQTPDGWVNVTATSGLTEDWALTFSGAFADYDGDGNLDLYVTSHGEFVLNAPPDGQLPLGEDHLYRGRGDGSFEDVSALLPEGKVARGFVGRWSDLDHDGDPDLYVANEMLGPVGEPNLMLRNDGPDDAGGWVFTRVTDCGCEIEMAGMGLAIGDVDRDGWQDLFITNSYLPSIIEGNSHLGLGEVLLRNLGGGSFVNASLALGAQPALASIEERTISWGTEFFDLENDGWLDAFVVYGPFQEDLLSSQPNALMRGGPEGFVTVPRSGADDEADGRGLILADLNGDGCEDLVVANTVTPPRVYRNACRESGDWLELELEGTTSNRDALGAVIEVIVGDTVLRGEVLGGNVHGSPPRRVHIGLGDAPRVDVDITWPSGQRSSLRDVATRVRLQVQE